MRKQSILTVPLSEAKENRQDLRCHRGDGAATTGQLAELQRGSTGDAAFSLRSLAALDFRLAALTGSMGASE